MKQTRFIMGMPISIEIVDIFVTGIIFDEIFEYFSSVDTQFSPYKKESEVFRINRGLLKPNQYSAEMKLVLALSEQTKQETNGYFNVWHNKKFDPSGLVKGWAIQNAAEILKKKGYKNFYVDAGGDIQVAGRNAKGDIWSVGIRNPFTDPKIRMDSGLASEARRANDPNIKISDNSDRQNDSAEIVKVLFIENKGVATSGTYIRGQHIYNPNFSDSNIRIHPNDPNGMDKMLTDIVSITVIGPNIYEADRFATAAFAMQDEGIYFIERLAGFEGYMIDKEGIATMTSGLEQFAQSQKVKGEASSVKYI